MNDDIVPTDPTRSQPVIPTRSDAMTQFLPTAFRADLDDGAARLVVHRLLTVAADAITPDATTPHNSSTAAYNRYIDGWCAYAKVARCDLSNLTHDERCDLADAWLNDGQTKYSYNAFRQLKSALRWWASSEGVDSPLTEVGRSMKGLKPPHGPALPLTQAELEVLLQGLNNNAVYQGTERLDERWVIGWHLRQKAAICIAITCSLRTESELRQLTDATVIRIDSDGIQLRIPRTKPRRHRDIILRPRNDDLCPVTALTRWLEWCRDESLERPEGVLLPCVRPNKTSKPLALPHKCEKRLWERHVTAYLQQRGIDMTNKTLHGCRAMAITAAVDANWDCRALRDLGDWHSLQVAAGYARGTTDDISAHLDQRGAA